MKKHLLIPFLCAAAICISPRTASGQFGGLGKKIKQATNSATGDSAAYAQSTELAAYLTLAVDQGMQALNEIASVFPPEKVQAFKELSAKYHEAEKKRGSGNLDAENLALAGNAAAEIEKLAAEWQCYRKEKAPAIRKAHARLGLMLIADAYAAERAPQTLNDLQYEIQAIAGNPTQATRLGQMRTTATFLNAVVQHVPKQLQSFRSIRATSKKIADAERFQLAADPSPQSLTGLASISAATKEIEVDIPAPSSGGAN